MMRMMCHDAGVGHWKVNEGCIVKYRHQTDTAETITE